MSDLAPNSRTATSADAGSPPGADAASFDPSRCAHCALPVPRSSRRPAETPSFCCNGCEIVYRVIRSHGLERYYRIRRDQPDAEAGPARVSERSYAELDDPKFEELYVRRDDRGRASVELYLENVHCAACVWLVEKTPVVLSGVLEARLDLGRSMARVTWDPDLVTLSDVGRFIDSLGYPVHPFRGVALREMRRREDRDLLIRIGVAGFSAGNVMLMAFALYGGELHGMEAEWASLFRWGSLSLALPAVLWSAGVFYRGAWGALKARALHMDVPISIGIVAGSLSGAWHTIAGRGDVYFDSVTTLILFLLAGRWLQRRQQRKATDSAELLYALTPSSARKLDPDGNPRDVPLEALGIGDAVEVRAGESIPVDGRVRDGASDLDTSLLTGESRPVGVGPGHVVHAGTVNLSSDLVVTVDRTGEDTRVGRLMQLVDDATRRKAPVVHFADRLSGIFVAVVLSLAVVTLAIWWRAGVDVAVDHAVALLVVTCPCALGLATPLALSAALGRAGRAGILVKGGDVLERLSRVGTVWLDKTGTITEGRSRVERFAGDASAGPLVAALERRVSHPVARALSEAFDADERDVRVVGAQGGGVSGTVAGHRVAAGSPGYMMRRGTELPDWASRTVRETTAAALTPVVVEVDGRVRAVAGLGDPVRDDSAKVVRTLRERGWTVGILSGDHDEVVRSVGARVGVEPSRAHGARLPEHKLDAVESATADSERRAAAPVVMVGDGVNDAAALSAASVGVAVDGGAEAAMAAADVYLARPGLGPLLELFDGANRTMRVIRTNLVLSLSYNVVGAALAMAGVVSPLAAAVLMPLSSLTVISISYRSRTFYGSLASESERPAARVDRPR